MGTTLLATLLGATLLIIVGFSWLVFRLITRIDKLMKPLDHNKVFVPVDPNSVFLRSIRE